MQGAGNGRQQVDAPLAPLGVSATQESDSGVPQSESEYKGLDELLGKAKRGRDGEKEGGLTWDEESAIVSYKSGDSYGLNGKLSEGGAADGVPKPASGPSGYRAGKAAGVSRHCVPALRFR